MDCRFNLHYCDGDQCGFLTSAESLEEAQEIKEELEEEGYQNIKIEVIRY